MFSACFACGLDESIGAEVITSEDSQPAGGVESDRVCPPDASKKCCADAERIPSAASTTASMAGNGRYHSKESVVSEAAEEAQAKEQCLQEASGSTPLAPKSLRAMTDQEFMGLYRLGSHVMESCHRGTYLRFAERLADGLEVVVKVRSKNLSFSSAEQKDEWIKTTEAQLNMPRSEVVCELMELFETSKFYYVVMEKVEGHDLAMKVPWTHCEAREIMRQILKGVEVFHNAGKIHKDMKLDNVVVAKDQSGQVSAKLIDFDTVVDWKVGDPRSPRVVGSSVYIAPEAYDGCYSPAADMYSVGVVMYKLLTRSFPIDPTTLCAEGENVAGSPGMKRVQKRVRGAKVNFSLSPLDACPEAVALCKALLEHEPEKRPSAADALAHEWFALDASALPEQKAQEASAKPKGKAAMFWM